MPNHVSIRFIHDAEVGVQWDLMRGSRSSQALTTGVVWVGRSTCPRLIPEQANSMGVDAAMLPGAFGGAMMPPEVFPDIMRTASHITPHAWAVDALRATRVDAVARFVARYGHEPRQDS